MITLLGGGTGTEVLHRPLHVLLREKVSKAVSTFCFFWPYRIRQLQRC